MSRKKKTGREPFVRLLSKASEMAELCAFHSAKYRDALESGLTEKPARAEASEATAKKYRITRRRVEQIVGSKRKQGERAELERSIRRLPIDASWRQFDRRAKVAEWLTPDEVRATNNLADMALMAYPRLYARARELEIALRAAERIQAAAGAALARTEITNRNLQKEIQELRSEILREQAAAVGTRPRRFQRN